MLPCRAYAEGLNMLFKNFISKLDSKFKTARIRVDLSSIKRNLENPPFIGHVNILQLETN